MIIFLKFSKSKTTFSSVIMAKKTIYFGEFKIIFAVTLFKNRCSDSQKTMKYEDDYKIQVITL